jgi:hypothetical protein
VLDDAAPFVEHNRRAPLRGSVGNMITGRQRFFECCRDLGVEHSTFFYRKRAQR